ncbi:pyrroline-5-carboxylate reductase [Oligoflexia bacterium]|nr:pyrroline-5-carboxylate reductase [Oligoflexia bacterium]
MSKGVKKINSGGAGMRVAILGGGVIGGIFAEAFLKSNCVRSEDLLIVEKDAQRREGLNSTLGCRVVEGLGDFLKEYGLLILAVKPQNMPDLCRSLKPYLEDSQIVLTIMAGCTVKNVAAQLGEHRCVLRAMPNLPAKIGLGMTVYIAGAGVSAEEKERVAVILSCTGVLLEVFEEHLLDAATAVTGSGPGFVFYLMEHYLNATAELGFPEEDLTLLVSQTFRGVVELLIQEQKTPRELREMVATKGGTTEAGLRVFRDQGLGQILKDGIKAANDRSCELAEGVK